jgi:signal transduction histidine kinase/ActR/RegA family two-component response regulator
VLGTFGTYFRERREPSEDERRSVEILASTAALAVDRDRAEVARLAAETALRDADRRKDEFLAMLAHELRNPLAPISNAIRILRTKAPDADTTGRLHDMMERQLGHMVRLVDDLMEVSRISRGKVELRRLPLDLGAPLRDAMEASRSTIEGGRHRLHVDLCDEPLLVEADSVRLAQVFANLLNNAARYTPAGGDVWVRARRADGHAIVSVRDSGPGIDPALIDTVFDLFVQGVARDASGSSGLGIGLTLVRDLVALHGGSVEARNADGQGAEFVVRLPIAGRVERTAPAALPRADHVTHRVLVVDDNRDAADSLVMLLRHSGAHAWAVYDGPAALATIARDRPDVVLLDLGMPGMDGYEIARRIRARPDGGAISLVALTGWNQELARARTHDAGFDGHLSKPAELDALLAVLGTVRAAHSGADRGCDAVPALALPPATRAHTTDD